MTEKERRFADEWLIDCNGTRAYKVAYPNIKNDNSARVLASRLLTKASVKEYIDAKLKEISSKKIATVTEVMEYLTSVLRGESTAEIVVIEGIGDGCSEARNISKRPEEKERLKAAELLGKRFGMFTDNIKFEDALKITFKEDLNE